MASKFPQSTNHYQADVATKSKLFPRLSRNVLCYPGGAGEKVLMPGTGFLTVGAASALAFCQVLREEYPEVPCKLNQVCLSKLSSTSSWGYIPAMTCTFTVEVPN